MGKKSRRQSYFYRKHFGQNKSLKFAQAQQVAITNVTSLETARDVGKCPGLQI